MSSRRSGRSGGSAPGAWSATWSAKGGRLRDGLDEEAAADILWVLIDAGLFHLLVHRRGWAVERFQTWLAETIQRELLG